LEKEHNNNIVKHGICLDINMFVTFVTSIIVN